MSYSSERDQRGALNLFIYQARESRLSSLVNKQVEVHYDPPPCVKLSMCKQHYLASDN